ncbi:MAG: hypothetical protein M3Y08_06165 [Fibrobacterota bacterium]|nr:hypothetical protein [Fibrobacterota bacterium]
MPSQTDRGPGDPGQRGAALVYVLVLLTIVGTLVGLGWRLIRANNNLAALNQAEAQACLLAQTGLSYALAQIGPPGHEQNLRYATEGLTYHLDGTGRIFELKVASLGLFARARSRGETSLPRPGRTKVLSAVLGQELDLGRLPALTLFSRGSNLVLAGKSQITGPVLLWRGRVEKSTDAAVRFQGGAGHVGALWDSTSPAWKGVNPDFSRAEAWMKSQSEALGTLDPGKDPDFDSGMVQNIRLSDSAVLSDTAMVGARIIAKRVLRIGTGVRLLECKLLSGSIEIEKGSDLRRVVAYAERNITIRGGRIRGGQYLAGDTLRIASDSPLEGYPVFYAQGKVINRGSPDSTMSGAMILERAMGKGLFLASFRERPVGDENIRLVVKAGTRLTGLLFTNGYAQMEGDLEGSLVCQNLKSIHGGTLWIGHLLDAHIWALPKGNIVPAPLLFPACLPAAFGGHGP